MSLLAQLAAPEQQRTFCSEMPGAGRLAPSRNKAIMALLNNSFMHGSGGRNARTNTLRTVVAPG
jgi:hypothetical protein